MTPPEIGPYCECTACDARGNEIRLPVAAWAVAGGGPSEQGGGLAVAPGHERRFIGTGHHVRIIRHRGWVEIADGWIDP